MLAEAPRSSLGAMLVGRLAVRSAPTAWSCVLLREAIRCARSRSARPRSTSTS